MDWKSRVRSTFAASAPIPDDDVVEELAQHARAMYETARADGCSHDAADRRVADQLERWRLDAAALRRPRVVLPPSRLPRWSPGLASRDSCRNCGTPAGCSRGIPASPRSPRCRWRSASARTARFSVCTTRSFCVRCPCATLAPSSPSPRPAPRTGCSSAAASPIPTTATCGNASQSFDGLIAYQLSTVSFARSRQTVREMRMGMLVSDNFFDVLGIQPVLGRRFTPEEGQVPGRDAVVVLGHDFWKNVLAEDRSVARRRRPDQRHRVQRRSAWRRRASPAWTRSSGRRFSCRW